VPGIFIRVFEVKENFTGFRKGSYTNLPDTSFMAWPILGEVLPL
jgi:hypothetical protein